jgi:hypothetical protein
LRGRAVNIDRDDRTAELPPIAACQFDTAVQGQETVQRFKSEITELRALGFAESLPIQPVERASDVVARLESGRIGVAVEFRADARSTRYAVEPLVPQLGSGPVATDVWSDVVKDIHRRAPLGDDD